MSREDLPYINADLNVDRGERYMSTRDELAEAALVAAGIDEPRYEATGDLQRELTDIIEDTQFGELENIRPNVSAIITELAAMIQDTQHMLATANYNGAEYARQSAQQINEAIDTIRQKYAQIKQLTEDAHTGFRSIESQVEGPLLNLRADAHERYDDDMLRKVRRLEDALEELRSGGLMLTRSYDDAADLLNNYAPLQNALNELMFDSWGHETSIARIRSELNKLDDGLGFVYRSASAIEGSIEDIRRISK